MWDPSAAAVGVLIARLAQRLGWTIERDAATADVDAIGEVRAPAADQLEAQRRIAARDGLAEEASHALEPDAGRSLHRAEAGQLKRRLSGDLGDRARHGRDV